MEEQVNFEFIKTTEYISIWNWHLTAMLFLVGTIIQFTLESYLFVVFFAAFLFSEFLSLKKKSEFYKKK